MVAAGQNASSPSMGSPMEDINTHFYKKKSAQIVVTEMDEEDETCSTKEHITADLSQQHLNLLNSTTNNIFELGSSSLLADHSAYKPSGLFAAPGDRFIPFREDH